MEIMKKNHGSLHLNYPASVRSEKKSTSRHAETLRQLSAWLEFNLETIIDLAIRDPTGRSSAGLLFIPRLLITNGGISYLWLCFRLPLLAQTWHCVGVRIVTSRELTAWAEEMKQWRVIP